MQNSENFGLSMESGDDTQRPNLPHATSKDIN